MPFVGLFPRGFIEAALSESNVGYEEAFNGAEFGQGGDYTNGFFHAGGVDESMVNEGTSILREIDTNDLMRGTTGLTARLISLTRQMRQELITWM